MRIYSYFILYGGFTGLITFLLSIIVFALGLKELALILDTITLLTLNPYFTHQAYYTDKMDYLNVSPLWNGKFGSIINLVFLLNFILYSVLVYANTQSALYVIFTIIFLLFIYPKINNWYVKKNEFNNKDFK